MIIPEDLLRQGLENDVEILKQLSQISRPKKTANICIEDTEALLERIKQEGGRER